MGTDIHAYVINRKTGEYTQILGGFRNSNFFNTLQGNCDSNVIYAELPYGANRYSFGDLPKAIQDKYREVGGYGLNIMEVSDYIRWFDNTKPHLDAGWCTKREEWEYKTRDIIPELSYCLSRDDVIEDMSFIEVVDSNSPWLTLSCEIEDVVDNAKHDHAYVFCYFFDC